MAIKKSESGEIDDPHEKLQEMAREQGVKPFNPENIPKDLWPKDESVDDFLELVREMRKS